MHVITWDSWLQFWSEEAVFVMLMRCCLVIFCEIEWAMTVGREGKFGLQC